MTNNRYLKLVNEQGGMVRLNLYDANDGFISGVTGRLCPATFYFATPIVLAGVVVFPDGRIGLIEGKAKVVTTR